MHNTSRLNQMPRLRRAAGVAAALLGVAVTGLIAPGTSQAGVCAVGDFCMWRDFSERGGLYQHHGSDANLRNDFFENTDTNMIVADNTISFRNRGISGTPHVRVWIGINGSGSFTCAPQGSRGHFRFDPNTGINWANNVESFAWRSSC
jgi:hypothetical protein